ncbi:ABC transporter permease subunit [Ferdinandcohnia quinoae]|uniref:ABC transporter permease subunit n=1 Tax=Fredinandcohnia quinoae TaxID=2918902 RepID=A0AAW5E0S2_9BACI|nr:ABC transporter permease subunit [Fredinandcohnia sp. SECRCQ15]MCH1626506.1 ABC transporter permease subunit [Fredinandcohnia sp. SECRCQ15]
MRRFSFYIGISILSFILLMAIIGPYLPMIDTELSESLYIKHDNGKIEVPPYPPSKDYLLGSDRRGVDLLSRLVVGARETLVVIFGIVFIRFMIGLLLGLGSLYSRVIRGVLNIWYQLFSYIPSVFLIVMIVGIPFFLFSPSRAYWFVFVIALIEVGRVGDVIYKLVKEIAGKPYYEAGIVAGCTPFRLSRKYIFPNMKSQLVTIIVNELGRTLFLIAQLGIVGIFISMSFEADGFGGYNFINTSDSWALVLSGILKDMWSAKIIPMSAIFLISLTVLSFYLVGNGVIRRFNKR